MLAVDDPQYVLLRKEDLERSQAIVCGHQLPYFQTLSGPAAVADVRNQGLECDVRLRPERVSHLLQRRGSGLLTLRPEVYRPVDKALEDVHGQLLRVRHIKLALSDLLLIHSRVIGDR